MRSYDTKDELLKEIKQIRKEIKKCKSKDWNLATSNWKVYLNLLLDRIKEKVI